MNDDRTQDPDLDPEDEQGVLEFINRGDDDADLDLMDDEDLAGLGDDADEPPDGIESESTDETMEAVAPHRAEETVPPPAPAPKATTPAGIPKPTATPRGSTPRRRFPPIMIAAVVVIVAGAVFLLNPNRGKKPLRQEGPKSSLLTAVAEEPTTTTETTPQSSLEEMDTIDQPPVPETAGAAEGEPEAAPATGQPVVETRSVQQPAQSENIPDLGDESPGPADPAKPGPDGGLCIQVGVGSDAEGAGRQAAALTERGHRALVVPYATTRGEMYRVVVGYFTTSTAATAYLDRYHGEFPAGAWVRSR